MQHSHAVCRGYFTKVMTTYSVQAREHITAQMSQGLAALAEAAMKQRAHTASGAAHASDASASAASSQSGGGVVTTGVTTGVASAVASDAARVPDQAAGRRARGSVQAAPNATDVSARDADDAAMPAADPRVSATALLVGCKAAGAAAAAMLALRDVISARVSFASRPGGSMEPGSPAWHWRHQLPTIERAMQRIEECARLLQLLVQPLAPLLPPKQLQLLAAAEWSGDQRTDAWLQLCAALQHVVVPGSAGCCNPRCMNLEGPSEKSLELFRCSKCGKSSYCCRACQKVGEHGRNML